MAALVKALLLIARSFRRIAVSLEHLEALYRLQLMQQGIYQTDPTLTDDVEVSYGAKAPGPLDDFDSVEA